MAIRLEQAGNNQTIVTVGGVDLFFSYEACIAFRAAGTRLANPKYRGYSRTTSKHFGQLGVRDYPDASDEAAFESALAAAIAGN